MWSAAARIGNQPGIFISQFSTVIWLIPMIHNDLVRYAIQIVNDIPRTG
jgi:hypothetical protein